MGSPSWQARMHEAGRDTHVPCQSVALSPSCLPRMLEVVQSAPHLPLFLSKKGAAEGFERSQRKPQPVRLGSQGREACFLGAGRHGVEYHSPLHRHTWRCVSRPDRVLLDRDESTRSGEKSTWSITGLGPDDLVWPRFSFSAKEIFIFLARPWRSWKFSPMGSLRAWDPSLRASGRRGGRVRWLMAGWMEAEQEEESKLYSGLSSLAWVALRCVALRCVALRCRAEHTAKSLGMAWASSPYSVKCARIFSRCRREAIVLAARALSGSK
ncbi:hypothetical protein LZ31DRAFT_19445 [Colletotrichum somersetense]|nr:hypothetical protein LZ31DRAFT_19445 [Colletotrichum somersetense]